MTVKLHINAGTGLFEIEGDPDFVPRIYEDLKSVLLERLVRYNANPQELPKTTTFEPAASEPNGDATGKKARRGVTKRAGPSCADRIISLKGKGFFSGPQSGKQVKEGLRDDGHSYQSNQVAAALTNLHGRGELRRTGAEGKWQYVNP